MSIPSRSAEIICIGTELLLGNILNGNARWLAEQLASLGIPHYFQQVVGDNPERIIEAVTLAAGRSQLLIFTGGLGPTPDDLTHATLARCFGVELTERPEIIADIRAKYAARGRTPTANNFSQALLPEGAEVLPNPSGTAPGLLWQPRPDLTLMTFPGVPAEMHRMWTETAVPWLRQQAWSDAVFTSRMLRFWGVTESALAEQVQHLFDLQNPTVAPYANYGEVKLRITVKAASDHEGQTLIAPVEAEIRAIAGADCYGADEDSLASVVGELLRQRGETLTVAESCTGGGLGQLITTVPGSSAWFLGGAIAYDNRIKQSLLGVSADVLSSHGAVSAPVAAQMARGIQERLGSDWALSLTGIAGPDGGSEDKPVGLVFIGLAGPDNQVETFRMLFGGLRGRDWVRHLSAQDALDKLRRQLQHLPRP